VRGYFTLTFHAAAQLPGTGSIQGDCNKTIIAVEISSFLVYYCIS